MCSGTLNKDFELESFSCAAGADIQDFGSGVMRENSGIDTATSRTDGVAELGDLWVVADGGEYPHAYPGVLHFPQESEVACEARTKVKLPRYLSQAEDISVNACAPGMGLGGGDECIYIGDIGAYGTDTLYIIPYSSISIGAKS